MRSGAAIRRRILALVSFFALAFVVRGAIADTYVRTGFVYFENPAPDQNGFESGIVNVEYAFASCPGGIGLLYQIKPETFLPGGFYRFEGRTYPSQLLPKQSISSVRFAGRVMSGGTQVGTFAVMADRAGMGCFGGNSVVVGHFKEHLKPDATDLERDQFLETLSLVVEKAPVYQSYEIDNFLRNQAREAEKAEAAKKEQEEKEKREKEAAEKEEAEKKKAAEAQGDDKSADDKTAANGEGNGSSSGGQDGDSDGSDGDTKKQSESGKSNAGRNTAAGAGGVAAAAAAGSTVTGGGEPDEEPRGPSTATPVVGTLATLVVGGLSALAVVSLSESLSTRLDETWSRLNNSCLNGDSGACAERDELRTHLAGAEQGVRPWDLDALLGPTIGFGLGVGYVRERHIGQADPDYPIALDGSLTGLAIELAFRLRFLRFQAGYQHLRGNLLGSPDDFNDGYRFSESQGIDSLSMGVAAQLGFHHLIAPYAGFKFRRDFLSGHFDEGFTGLTEREMRGLSGGRSVATLGATINLPMGAYKVMSAGMSLNLEVYRSLSDPADTTLDSGFLMTFGYAGWLAPWVSRVDGMSGAIAGEQTYRSNAIMPYIFSGGAGVQFYLKERGYLSFSAIDAWYSPSTSSGVAFASFGPVLPLTPDRLHAVGVRFSALAVQHAIEVEDGMDVDLIGIGAVAPYYRAQLHNHTAELSLKVPLVWARRAGDTTSWFDGRPTMLLSAGLGY